MLLSVSGLFDAISDPAAILNAQGVTYVNPVSGDQITILDSVNIRFSPASYRLGGWAQSPTR